MLKPFFAKKQILKTKRQPEDHNLYASTSPDETVMIPQQSGSHTVFESQANMLCDTEVAGKTVYM